MNIHKVTVGLIRKGVVCGVIKLFWVQLLGLLDLGRVSRQVHEVVRHKSVLGRGSLALRRWRPGHAGGRGGQALVNFVKEEDQLMCCIVKYFTFGSAGQQFALCCNL